MSDIAAIIGSIRRGLLLSKETFQDVEQSLLRRDELGFDQNWVRVFEQVVSRPLPISEQTSLDAVLEMAFKVAFSCCEDTDLAGYISDDFELIGRSVATLWEEPFVASLLATYASGQIPGGGSLVLSTSLHEEVNKLVLRLDTHD